MQRVNTLAIVIAIGLSVGCGSNEVEVAWTIEGAEATTEACDAVIADTMRVITYADADNPDDPPSPLTAEVACDAGSTTATVGSDRSVWFELLRGDIVAGVGGPFTAGDAGGGALGGEAVQYVGDVEMVSAQLTVTFNTVEGSICDLDPGAITMSLRQRVTGLDTTEVDSADVSCSDGAATYVYADAQIGQEYLVVASATADGNTFVTAPPGASLNIDRPAVTRAVNMILDD